LRSAVIVSAAIVAVAIVAAVGLSLYFSPYHSCVRALVADDYAPADAALACLQGIEPEDRTERTDRPLTRTRWSATAH
jgi:hypothetical protein